MNIPVYERCPETIMASDEHVVVESDVSYDGHTYMGWCKFCGEVVYAEHSQDYWHPYRMHLIEEEPV
ncbi:MAG TPA: hypothetical protein VFH56_02845 [Acidimicrobiales bacterium]|nr:hypothetical protein [Acidimicrobiales bacterium]